MEPINDQDTIKNVDFCQIKIQEHTCNINRKNNENLFILQNFGDTIPEFSVENGPHLILNQKSPKPLIVPLSGNVASSLLIPDSRKMSDDEYFSAFVEKKKSFVKDYLIKKTYENGFEHPSAVQALCIPELIQKKDALVQFKSGTGKTHGFLFGCLWGFDPNDKELQYIFVTSSHEVAIQIYTQAKTLLPNETKISLCIGRKKDSTVSGDFKSGFSGKPSIGTSSLNQRPKSINEERMELGKAQVIVCTMGRFYDTLINKKWFDVSYLKTICVDEFDNIVSSSSRQKSSMVSNTADQFASIIKKLSPDTQRVFFSATVSGEALEIAYSYFRQYNPRIGEPFIVLLDFEDYTLEGIRQFYVQCCTNDEKQLVLKDLLMQCRIAQGIVFTNRIETAKRIKQFLDNQDIHMTTAIFHGELSGEAREKIHKDFLSNNIRLLISTDVTARGFDVQGVNVVINFDMPGDFEIYVHRIGRSGRHGRKGVSISLILVNDMINETIKLQTINDRSKLSPISQLPLKLDDLL